MSINVFVVEKQSIIREDLQRLLQKNAGIKVLGSASELTSVKLIPKICDVILMELDTPLRDTLHLMKEIFKTLPAIKIIFLSDQPDTPKKLRKLLEGGASAYMTKNASEEELFSGVKKVYQGGLYVCTAFILRVLSKFEGLMEQDFEEGENYNITAGEMKVLALIAEGLTNRDIAQKLSLSVRTVETRRKKLLEKTETTNTATLIRFAVKANLIS